MTTLDSLIIDIQVQQNGLKDRLTAVQKTVKESSAKIPVTVDEQVLKKSISDNIPKIKDLFFAPQKFIKDALLLPFRTVSSGFKSALNSIDSDIKKRFTVLTKEESKLQKYRQQRAKTDNKRSPQQTVTRFDKNAIVPSVDFSQLHELNDLLDIKLAHYQQVQRYFQENPLIPIGGQSSGNQSVIVTNQKSDIDISNNKFLESIDKNINKLPTTIKSAIPKQGLLGKIGDSLITGLGVNTTKGVGKGISEGLDSVLKESLGSLEDFSRELVIKIPVLSQSLFQVIKEISSDLIVSLAEESPFAKTILDQIESLLSSYKSQIQLVKDKTNELLTGVQKDIVSFIDAVYDPADKLINTAKKTRKKQESDQGLTKRAIADVYKNLYSQLINQAKFIAKQETLFRNGLSYVSQLSKKIQSLETQKGQKGVNTLAIDKQIAQLQTELSNLQEFIFNIRNSIKDTQSNISPILNKIASLNTGDNNNIDNLQKQIQLLSEDIGNINPSESNLDLQQIVIESFSNINDSFVEILNNLEQNIKTMFQEGVKEIKAQKVNVTNQVTTKAVGITKIEGDVNTSIKKIKQTLTQEGLFLADAIRRISEFFDFPVPDNIETTIKALPKALENTGVNAGYAPDNNQLFLSQSIIDAINEGKTLLDLPVEQMTTVVHELIHAFQTAFGEVNDLNVVSKGEKAFSTKLTPARTTELREQADRSKQDRKKRLEKIGIKAIPFSEKIEKRLEEDAYQRSVDFVEAFKKGLLSQSSSLSQVFLEIINSSFGEQTLLKQVLTSSYNELKKEYQVILDSIKQSGLDESFFLVFDKIIDNTGIQFSSFLNEIDVLLQGVQSNTVTPTKEINSIVSESVYQYQTAIEGLNEIQKKISLSLEKGIINEEVVSDFKITLNKVLADIIAFEKNISLITDFNSKTPLVSEETPNVAPESVPIFFQSDIQQEPTSIPVELQPTETPKIEDPVLIPVELQSDIASGDLQKELTQEIPDPFGDIEKGANQSITKIEDSIDSLDYEPIYSLDEALDFLKKSFKDTSNSISGDSITNINDTLQKLDTEVQTPDDVKQIAGKIRDQFSSANKALKQAVKDKNISVIQAYVDVITKGKDRAFTDIKKTFAGFKQAIEVYGSDAVFDTFGFTKEDVKKTENQVDQMLSTISRAVNDAVGIGKRVKSGYIKGIDPDSLVDTGEKIGDNLIKGAEDSLEISSPSKRFFKIAQNVILGLKKGISDVDDIGTKIGAELIDSTENKLGIASASKKFIAIAKNIILGLQKGISNTTAIGVQIGKELIKPFTSVNQKAQQAGKQTAKQYSQGFQSVEDEIEKTLDELYKQIGKERPIKTGNVRQQFNQNIKQTLSPEERKIKELENQVKNRRIKTPYQDPTEDLSLLKNFQVRLAQNLQQVRQEIMSEVNLPKKQTIFGAIKDELGDTSSKLGQFVQKSKQWFKDFGLKGALGVAGLIGAFKLVSFGFDQLGNFIQNTISNIGQYANEVFNVTIAYDKFRSTLELTTGSANFAESALDSISEKAYKLGINIQAIQEQYSKFIAAVQGTAIQNEGQRIFEGFATASSALGLSEGDIQGIFTALQQIAAKGKVTAEEFRQQLSERLPIASQTMAEALGMTQKEFTKALDSGKIKLEDLTLLADALATKFGNVENIDNTTKGFERLKNEIYQSQLALGQALAPTIKTVLNILSTGLKTIRENGLKIIAAFLLTINATLVSLGVSVTAIIGTALKGIGTILANMGGLLGIVKSLGVALGKFAIYFVAFEAVFSTIKNIQEGMNGIKTVTRETQSQFELATKEADKFTKAMFKLQTATGLDLNIELDTETLNPEIESAKKKLEEITPKDGFITRIFTDVIPRVIGKGGLETRATLQYYTQLNENLRLIQDSTVDATLAQIKLSQAIAVTRDDNQNQAAVEAIDARVKSLNNELAIQEDLKQSALATQIALQNEGKDEEAQTYAETAKNIQSEIDAKKQLILKLQTEKAVRESNITTLQEQIDAYQREIDRISALNQVRETQLESEMLKGNITQETLDKERLKSTRDRIAREIELEQDLRVKVLQTRQELFEAISAITGMGLSEITDEFARAFLLDTDAIDENQKEIFRNALDRYRDGNTKLKQLESDLEKNRLEILKAANQERLKEIERNYAERTRQINTEESKLTRLIQQELNNQTISKELAAQKENEIKLESISDELSLEKKRLRDLKRLRQQATTIEEKDSLAEQIAQSEEKITQIIKDQGDTRQAIFDNAIANLDAVNQRALQGAEYREKETNRIILEYRRDELALIQENLAKGLISTQEAERQRLAILNETDEAKLQATRDRIAYELELERNKLKYLEQLDPTLENQNKIRESKLKEADLTIQLLEQEQQIRQQIADQITKNADAAVRGLERTLNALNQVQTLLDGNERLYQSQIDLLAAVSNVENSRLETEKQILDFRIQDADSIEEQQSLREQQFALEQQISQQKSRDLAREQQQQKIGLALERQKFELSNAQARIEAQKTLLQAKANYLKAQQSGDLEQLAIAESEIGLALQQLNIVASQYDLEQKIFENKQQALALNEQAALEDLKRNEAARLAQIQQDNLNRLTEDQNKALEEQNSLLSERDNNMEERLRSSDSTGRLNYKVFGQDRQQNEQPTQQTTEQNNNDLLRFYNQNSDLLNSTFENAVPVVNQQTADTIKNILGTTGNVNRLRLEAGQQYLEGSQQLMKPTAPIDQVISKLDKLLGQLPINLQQDNVFNNIIQGADNTDILRQARNTTLDTMTEVLKDLSSNVRLTG